MGGVGTRSDVDVNTLCFTLFSVIKIYEFYYHLDKHKTSIGVKGRQIDNAK